MKRRKKKSLPKVRSLTEMAKAIIGRFGVACSKQSITNWRKWQPPFPAPNAENRYDVQDCFDWVEKFYIPKQAASTTPDMFMQREEAKSRREINRANREEAETGKVLGTLIDRDDARQKMTNALVQLHQFVREEVEVSAVADRRDKLMQLGVSPEHVALFYEYDLANEATRFDRLSARCEQAAKEANAIIV